MKCKYYLSFNILLSLLHFSHVSGHSIPREVEHGPVPAIDELDTLMINQTGCKIVSLAKDESVFFTKNSAQFAHTTMASLLAEETLVDQNQTEFEMHFGIRSSSEVRVLLFTRRQYVNTSRTESDFNIVFGSHDNQKSYVTLVSTSDTEPVGMAAFEDVDTKNILSNDQYAKLYIKLHDSVLQFGKQCEQDPLLAYDNLGYHSVEFVQFGFLSTSESGAKILFDCPSNFGGCSQSA